MKIEQYKCQSYYDDNNILQDCTCGKCESLLQEQLKKFEGWWDLNEQDECIPYPKKDDFQQFLTNFYHEIRKEEQKSKIIAIEKKMLKDSFIDDLVELRVNAKLKEIYKGIEGICNIKK